MQQDKLLKPEHASPTHAKVSKTCCRYGNSAQQWIYIQLLLDQCLRCLQDHATVTLRTESGFKLGSHSQSGCGLMDLAFFPHTPHIVAAGSLHGEVPLLLLHESTHPSFCAVVDNSAHSRGLMPDKVELANANLLLNHTSLEFSKFLPFDSAE